MTTEELLATLREDYDLRAALVRKKLAVHNELEDEIWDLERSYITGKVMPELQALAQKLLKDLECGIYLSVQSDGAGEVWVEDGYQPATWYEGVSPELPDVPEVGPQDNGIVITPANINDVQGRNMRITIDNAVFEEKSSIQTFIKALEYIGLDRIPQVGITIKGYNLVDHEQRTDGRGRWQQQVGDWWVYVYYSNTTKVTYLFQIAAFFNLNIKIEAI